MNMKKGFTGQKILSGVLLCFMLLLCAAATLGEGFQADPDGIGKAAKSVLLLEVYDKDDDLIAIGSGFVMFDNRTLVTNNHVIEDAALIIAYNDGDDQYMVTRVIAADEKKDIALLEFFSPTDLTPLPLADTGKLRLTEPVVAILGSDSENPRVAQGNISALYDEDGVSYIQFSAPFSYGFGGGALLNSQGEVIGITSDKQIDGQSMSLAVDIAEAAFLYAKSAIAARTDLKEFQGRASGYNDASLPPVALDVQAYLGGSPVDRFERTIPVVMGGLDDYAIWGGGVLAFRGGPLRQNAAFGTLGAAQGRLEVIWSAPTGGAGLGAGMGFACQPVIVKWPKEIREMGNIVSECKAIVAMKEVILASQDGHVYFLNLADGKPTRAPIDTGYPMHSAVSVDPRGIPMMWVGLEMNQTGRSAGTGLCLFSLIDQTRLYFIYGQASDDDSAGSAFYDSGLVDVNSDVLIFSGANGTLYTATLNTCFNLSGATITVDPKFDLYKSKLRGAEDEAVEMTASVAMYKDYAYIGNMAGVLQCVDVNTLSPVWAVQTGGGIAATAALEEKPDGGLALYTGNTLAAGEKEGVCSIRRLNALTGEPVWRYTAKVVADGGLAGCVASPVVGQNKMSDLVIFTVTGTADGGQIIALNKETGDVVWQHALQSGSVSSPVAVYNESGDAFILQGDSSGVLWLLDGQTGAVLDSMQLEGAIEGSPAAYNDILVVGSSGVDSGVIYGIRIK